MTRCLATLKYCAVHTYKLSLKVIMSDETLVTHTGGCHCNRVMFSCQTPENLEISECNCSICSKKGFLHLIIPKSRFTLLTPIEDISVYTFNTHTAKHYFCPVCGISPFYIPRSNPDGYDVNLRCITSNTIKSYKVSSFDGINWEEQMASQGRLKN